MELIVLSLILMGGLFGLSLFAGCFNVVGQGTVVVLTRFGKFARVQRAGLNFKIPIIENVAYSHDLREQVFEITS